MNCDATLEEGLKGFNFLWITNSATKKRVKITLNQQDYRLVTEFLRKE